MEGANRIYNLHHKIKQNRKRIKEEKGKEKMKQKETLVKAVAFLTVALLIAPVLVNKVEAAEDLPGDLFQFVWDDFDGYYIVSDEVFPLKVYVLSLPDVGNYRVSNHSDVVEGVRQATKIYPGDSDVKELVIPLWFGLTMKLNVSVSFHLVEDWETYKTLVESGDNTIIVNTHDEYLPVPEDYTKDGWTDEVADFMLNRWGTWVHAGGYPFYRVWYQNGTTEEWGENGFKRLMSHIGKGNLTCYPPDRDPTDMSNPATFSMWAAQGMGINWYLLLDNSFATSIATFDGANPGYPINFEDFEGQYIGGVYSLIAPYKPGAIIRFSQNQSAFNFGIYVHMGVWQFYDGSENTLPSDIGMGFISTAAAIYGEFTYAACKLYSRSGNSATEAIQKAEKEGRTLGLAEAKNLFQNALDAFASGNYKLAAAYAIQAKQTAEKAAAPNTLPQAIAIIITIAVPIGIGAYYKINRKKNKGRASECVERKRR